MTRHAAPKNETIKFRIEPERKAEFQRAVAASERGAKDGEGAVLRRLIDRYIRDIAAIERNKKKKEKP